MSYERVFKTKFSSIYQSLLDKATNKGRTIDEVLEVTSWLTGYSKEEIQEIMHLDTTYQEFFLEAPKMNEHRVLITGRICGMKVEEIEDPLIQNIRYLDKLVDELAKGKTVVTIKRTPKNAT